MKASSVFIIVLVIGVLGILQFSSPHIVGFDGYWHIKSAALIREKGFYDSWPWTQASILFQSYSDVQILFRILLVPFTFLGLMLGAKVYAFLASVSCFIFFYWFLVRKQIRYPWFWTSLYLLTSTELLYRFLEPRQMPMVIVLFLLVCLFLEEHSYLWLCVVMAIYTSFYSGFVFAVGACILYFLLEGFFKKWEYRLVSYPLLGVLVGLVVHPQFPHNISFLFTQWYDVNLVGNLYNQEWSAFPLKMLLLNVGILLLVFFIAFALRFFYSKKFTFSKEMIFYGLLSLIFLVLTLHSRRMIDYLFPFLLLFSGLLMPQFKRERFVYIGIFCSFLPFFIFVLFSTYHSVQDNDFYSSYQDVSVWMNGHVEDGSLVLNNAYAFPYLFFENSDIFYTHGVDLTYSYLYDKEKFLRYMAILFGKGDTSQDWVILDYHPDYVLVGKRKVDLGLFGYVQHFNKDYSLVYQDDHVALLKVKT